MRRTWTGLILSLMAPAALANAFFGSNPQPGSLFWGNFSNGSVQATISGPGFTGTVLAGQFQGLFDPTSEGDGLQPDDFFRFFCIDITHGVNAGPNAYTRITPTLDATRIAELSQLFDEYYPNKGQSTYYNGGQTSFGAFPDAISSAAFQLAVWEIVFDTDLNLAGAGTFTVDPSSAAFGAAQSELAWVAGHSGLAPGWTFFEFTSENYQDYISVEYTQALRTVPEPGSLLLLCSAVFAAGAAALRRRQTA